MVELFKVNFKAMGGVGEIQLYSSDKTQASKVCTKVISEVQRIEQKYSRYNQDSVLSKINLAAGKEQVLIDDETEYLIRYADTCFQQSEVLFDITSGVLRRVWDFSSNRLPKQEQIEAVLPLIGWQKVEWNGSNIKLPNEGMELDLGGIGKEYTVERAAAVMRQEGIFSGFVNLSGDIHCVGPQPGNVPWRIGIKHPRKAHSAITAIEVFRGAVATSGDYERFFEIDGNRYCHILNPLTGWPVNSFQGVSVLNDSCLIAGSLASVAMLLGEKAGTDFLNNIEIPYISISSKGKLDFKLKTKPIKLGQNEMQPA